MNAFDVLSENYAEVLEALVAITKYCISGERYKVANPYLVPEIKAAVHVLEERGTWLEK